MCLREQDCEARIDRLARTHTRFLADVARSEGLAADAALDATQEAFIRLLQMPGACMAADDPERAGTLLVTLVRNAARNLRRRHYRALPHESVDTDVPLDAPSPDALMGRAEEAGQLAVCMRGMDDLRRSIVRMRMLEELSGAEVARTLNLTPGHVAVLLHRAKADLRACMETGG